MNTTRFEETTLRPTYMSQAEANAVMDLWAERQREEAARQSMITVHDVAEATQLSSQDVERLLIEIRSAQPRREERTYDVPNTPVRQGNQPTLAEAYLRLAPITGVLSFILGMYLTGIQHSMSWNSGLKNFAYLLLFYAAVIAVNYVPKWAIGRFNRLKGAVEEYRRPKSSRYER